MKTGIALIIVCYSFILTINILTSERDIGYKSKEVFIPPPENVRLLSFGFHESLADSLWLRWIQTPEACGKSRIKRSTFEENFEGYKAKNTGKVDMDLGFDRDQRKVWGPLSFTKKRLYFFLMIGKSTTMLPTIIFLNWMIFSVQLSFCARLEIWEPQSG